MVEDYFLDPSKLGAVLNGYHPRMPQIDAAKLIDESFSSYRNLVLEAPTGSGKTMAYLIPTYIHGARTIISTKTKQLMQQLYLKDIPIMERLFGERNVATLKGRKNYFCPHRFQRWIYPNGVFYQDVIEWYNAQSDIIMELPRGYFDGAILDKMSADSRQCLYSKCEYYTVCPFQLAKNKANEALVVITNHYLLLTDIAMKANDEHGQIFEPADHLICDEAHGIPDIYVHFAGTELSVRRIVNTLLEYKDKLPFAELNRLSALAEKLAGKVNDGKIRFDGVQDDADEFMEFVSHLVQIAADDDLDNEYDYWETAYKTISSDATGVHFVEQRGRDLLLEYMPIDVGEGLVNGIGKLALSSVFISATLTTAGSFNYFLEETKLSDTTYTSAILPSVFKMSAQARLFVPKVAAADKDAILLELVKKSPGSTLIICNSLKRMEYLVSYLAKSQKAKVVFSQNDGDWSTFTAMPNIALVGCATLREGLDLAGGDFSCVIIDKLPFEYPFDLYFIEKSKQIEAGGVDAFSGYSLPRAVLYFKQAAGRLIRHESDKGLWVVMDERILTKSYGKYFLDMLDNVPMVNSVAEALRFLDDI